MSSTKHCLLPSQIAFILLCVILLNVVTTSSSYGGNETDHLALVSFKSMISLDPYRVLSSWNTSLHFCDWEAVTCTKRQRRVTSINLDSCGLVGSLSPHVGNLSFLLVLSLGNNTFHGSIPDELGRLFRLQYLELTTNNFDGVIPANLSHCSNIVELWLSRNNLVGKIPEEKRKDQGSGSLLNDQFLQVSYNQLLRATNGFSEENLIGVGGFGSVFKGMLDEVGLVAIKVLNHLNEAAYKSFMVECEALKNVRHRNLLKIVTACSSVDFKRNDFKALVYEFMPNGSLESWLHSSPRKPRLSLLQVINVLTDVACALDYLHNRCQTQIVHCDLKPSNILLDENMTAHVGDFGLARFLQTNTNMSSSIGIRGTIGYAAPEYGLGSETTTKGDVYSFGILLLEIITGKRPIDEMFGESLNLHKFASIAMPDHVMDIVDPLLQILDENNQATTKYNIRTSMHAEKAQECLVSVVNIGVACSRESSQDRIEIANVYRELQHIRGIIHDIGS